MGECCFQAVLMFSSVLFILFAEVSSDSETCQLLFLCHNVIEMVIHFFSKKLQSTCHGLVTKTDQIAPSGTPWNVFSENMLPFTTLKSTCTFLFTRFPHDLFVGCWC